MLLTEQRLLGLASHNAGIHLKGNVTIASHHGGGGEIPRKMMPPAPPTQPAPVEEAWLKLPAL